MQHHRREANIHYGSQTANADENHIESQCDWWPSHAGVLYPISKMATLLLSLPLL